MSEKIGNTQPLKPVKKTSRWRSILIGIVGIIILLALAGFGGYESAIATRVQAKNTLVSQQLMDQFKLALVDEQFKRYDDAKQRLDFIIQNDPSFPGAEMEDGQSPGVQQTSPPRLRPRPSHLLPMCATSRQCLPPPSNWSQPAIGRMP